MYRYTLIALLILSSCTFQKETKTEPVDLVNPAMGGISHLLVPAYPTVHLPNSMLRVYPNRSDMTGELLEGLPVLVVNHRFRSAFKLSPFHRNTDTPPAVKSYSYDQEHITPYAYEVYLDEEGIQVEFAPSRQSALYRMRFEGSSPACLSLFAGQGELHWDGTALSGHQVVEGQTRVYLWMEPEQACESSFALTGGRLEPGAGASGESSCMVLQFAPGVQEVVLRYGVSFIDAEQARKNMEREVSGQSLEEVAETGRKTWNEALGKIEVEGGNPDEQKVFYTSLYRCYERPVCVSEDGRYYSPFDRKVHNDGGRPFYTDEWIWDTYQAHHPLRILLDPKQEEDMIHSLVEMARQSDPQWMPTFPRITGDMRGMDSNHGVASVLDAHRKGLENFDLAMAYEAGKAAVREKTLAPWSGKPAGELDRLYREHGYIPDLNPGETETYPEVHPTERRASVTVTLGTAFDEWCLSEIAADLGLDEEAAEFGKGALNYRNLFNPETRFFQPRDKDGAFIEGINLSVPGKPEARGPYGENNAWIYNFDVKHNIPDLIELMGGAAPFAERLDQMYATPLDRSKYHFYRDMPDHTGNVGQFSMGNEPSLHIPYLYNYAGQPWKTQKRIRSLLNFWFRNDLMGIPGDEDGGGLSSFVVFSQLGFYPVTPGSGEYTIGSPAFDRVVIYLEDGKTFEVEAVNRSADNKYIQSASLNGQPLDEAWFSHEDLVQGGKLVLHMGPRANRNWGIP